VEAGKIEFLLGKANGVFYEVIKPQKLPFPYELKTIINSKIIKTIQEKSQNIEKAGR
jgi:hypothetical protein